MALCTQHRQLHHGSNRLSNLLWWSSTPVMGTRLLFRQRIDCVSGAAQEDRELEEEVEAARRAVLEAAAQRRREEGELDDEDLLIGAPAANP